MADFNFRNRDDGLSMFQPQPFLKPTDVDFSIDEKPVDIGFLVGTETREGFSRDTAVYTQDDDGHVHVVSDEDHGHARVPIEALDELIEALQKIQATRRG